MRERISQSSIAIVLFHMLQFQETKNQPKILKFILVLFEFSRHNVDSLEFLLLSMLLHHSKHSKYIIWNQQTQQRKSTIRYILIFSWLQCDKHTNICVWCILWTAICHIIPPHKRLWDIIFPPNGKCKTLNVVSNGLNVKIGCYNIKMSTLSPSKNR